MIIISMLVHNACRVSITYLSPDSSIHQFGNGSGPIYFDELDCYGTEESLTLCNRFSPLGLYECDHSEDAGVVCKGIPQY